MDKESSKGYAPSVRSVNKRVSLESLSQDLIQKYSLKYQIDKDDNISPRKCREKSQG